MANENIDLVTLLQLKTTSERIAAMISGLLTDEEVATLVDDDELAAAITQLRTDHQNILDKLEEVKTNVTYPSAEEASF